MNLDLEKLFDLTSAFDITMYPAGYLRQRSAVKMADAYHETARKATTYGEMQDALLNLLEVEGLTLLPLIMTRDEERKTPFFTAWLALQDFDNEMLTDYISESESESDNEMLTDYISESESDNAFQTRYEDGLVSQKEFVK